MVRGLRGLSACVIAVGAFLLAGTLESRAAADDSKICARESGDVAIDACSRAIKSGRYKGHELAREYLYRGVERRLKQDYDLALADFGDAARIDKKYADAFYNRCVIYNFKGDYDHALADCSQAIKLGPSPNAMAEAGGERLGNDRTISDYYSERGFAYLKKDDNSRAMLDLDNAIRLNPKNGRALKNRGLAYEARGDTARADADLQAAKQLGE
jgi:tetratricopeptide (TPR) repeat protein